MREGETVVVSRASQAEFKAVSTCDALERMADPVPWCGDRCNAATVQTFFLRKRFCVHFGLVFHNPSNNGILIGGGQVGFNYQFSNIVLGVESDYCGRFVVDVVVNRLETEARSNAFSAVKADQPRNQQSDIKVADRRL
jgi:hypothetical protein